MANDNMYNIQIKEVKMGNDYAFYITGGVAHIGAVATSYYEESSRLRTVVTELPHHKEGELAKECAEIAATSLNATVTVSMGIHVDHATKEQIDYIVDFVRKEMKNKITNLAQW